MTWRNTVLDKNEIISFLEIYNATLETYIQNNIPLCYKFLENFLLDINNITIILGSKKYLFYKKYKN